MKKRLLWCRRVGAFLLCLVMVAALSLPASATMTEQTLRVAYYPLDGFFEYDQQGHEIGYGVELLDKISQYSGIRFTYVAADSWEDTKQMLLDGRADLRMPASMPTTPSTVLSYGSTSILDTYHVMLTLNSREDLYYQDYDTIRTLKIAISRNFYQVNNTQSYFDSIGVTEDQLLFCNGYNDCYAALKSGEADALVSNIMDMDDSMKMLVRFNSISNYFSMTLDNPRLNGLNDALDSIKLDEPLFLSQLYSKWFPDRTIIPFTLEESSYLSTLDSLTFAFQSDEGYLSHRENGEYYGVYVELAKSVCDELGVGFHAVSYQECQDETARADVFSGFFYDRNYAKQWNFSLSTPVNDINYYIIQKKGESFDPATCKIAVMEKFRYTQDYLRRQYPKAVFLDQDSYEECLRAVADGKADMAVINNYIAEYYLGMYQFSDLTSRLSTEYSHLFCFAAAESNDLLASILSKALSRITVEEMNQLYIAGQEKRPESNYLQAMLYQNPVQCALLLGGAMVLLVTLALLILFGRRSKRQNRELEDALAAKRQFMAHMSHDMRTPMNGIIGLTYLMEDENEVSKIKEYIPQMRESSAYLLQLINDVLDVNRIEGGNLTLHPAVCNEEKLFDSVIEMMEPLIQAKNIDFHFVKNHLEWQYLLVDEQRAKQIFINLLSNAVKFTPRGGRIDFIMEPVSRTDTMLCNRFIVRDSGIGMSKAFLARAFEPFQQERRQETDSSKGTGLGLSIVKQLVELMGGTVAIDSQENKGTQVTITLNSPLAERPQSEAEAERTAPRLRFDGMRVLLCEDHPLNAKIAKTMMERVGVEVTWAENGKLGVDAFAASTVDFFNAVLMDVRMPVMDGLAAAEAIRALERPDAKTTPILAVTANAYREDVERTMAAGMNGHLCKPIEPKALYAALERVFPQ